MPMTDRQCNNIEIRDRIRKAKPIDDDDDEYELRAMGF